MRGRCNWFMCAIRCVTVCLLQEEEEVKGHTTGILTPAMKTPLIGPGGGEEEEEEEEEGQKGKYPPLSTSRTWC